MHGIVLCSVGVIRKVVSADETDAGRYDWWGWTQGSLSDVASSRYEEISARLWWTCKMEG